MSPILIDSTSLFLRPRWTEEPSTKASGQHLLVTGLTFEQCTITIVIAIVNILLKSFTTYFLHVLKRSRGSTTGIILSLNLCYNELGINMLALLTTVLAILPHNHISMESYVILAITTLLLPVLYFIKLFILLTEVFKVHIRYY